MMLEKQLLSSQRTNTLDLNQMKTSFILAERSCWPSSPILRPATRLVVDLEVDGERIRFVGGVVHTMSIKEFNRLEVVLLRISICA